MCISGNTSGGTQLDRVSSDTWRFFISSTYFNSGIPGCRVQPLIKPAHFTDGVIVAHERVLPPAVRDGVEITRRGTFGLVGSRERRCDHVHVQATYTLLSQEEHATVLPSTSSRHDDNACKITQSQPASQGSTGTGGGSGTGESRTMLEKDMLLWNSSSSLENIFSVESRVRKCNDE